MSLQRPDDFETRRGHLKELTDEELQARFWALTREIVAPLEELARTHTTPSIERSVALRMGFSSVEAEALVAGLFEHGLGGRGIGRMILNLMQSRGCTAREAGLALITTQCWEEAAKGGSHAPATK
ncbi:MAG: ornithine aminomutase subunit alpha [Candidatus Sumerlaeaceae bacterium]|nr:ornithine aminomutase subunit alpha [Candidatus Sumerlaeaceae bacterium]